MAALESAGLFAGQGRINAIRAVTTTNEKVKRLFDAAASAQQAGKKEWEKQAEKPQQFAP